MATIDDAAKVALAFPTALAFRLVTFYLPPYLPPLWGGFAMRWMKQQSNL